MPEVWPPSYLQPKGKITCNIQEKYPATLRQNYLHLRQASCNHVTRM